MNIDTVTLQHNKEFIMFLRLFFILKRFKAQHFEYSGKRCSLNNWKQSAQRLKLQETVPIINKRNIIRWNIIIQRRQFSFRKTSVKVSLKILSLRALTWDQALFSFRFENYIPAGKAKRKESLIQTFYETSAAHFFDWLTFAESANQNYFRCLFF